MKVPSQSVTISPSNPSTILKEKRIHQKVCQFCDILSLKILLGHMKYNPAEIGKRMIAIIQLYNPKILSNSALV